MMQRKVFFPCLVAVLVTAFPVLASMAVPFPFDHPEAEPSYLVTFHEGMDMAAAPDLIRSTGMEAGNIVQAVRLCVAFPVNGPDAEDALYSLESHPDVAFVEPNHLQHLLITPNDPYYSEQYGMEKIGMEDAWEIVSGDSDVIIAIIDTGARLDHPDLEGQFWVNEDEVPDNGVDDDGNGYVDDYNGYDFHGDGFFPSEGEEDSDPDDDNGHGTHCSGVAAAATNNGVGVAGVAPGCKIMPVRALGGMLGFGYTSDIIAAMVYAVDNGADVISMSFGAEAGTESQKSTLLYAYDEGVTLVAASGNSGLMGNPVMWPAAYPMAIAVGATNSFDGLAYFSSYGPQLEVSAPGMSIYSTVAGYLGMLGDYTYLSGTSMSCPHVAGFAGLLISQDPSRTNDIIRLMISSASVDLGDSGWDEKFGHGRIDVAASLSSPDPSDSEPHVIMPPDGANPFTEDVFGFCWSAVPGAAGYSIKVVLPSGAKRTVYSDDSIFFPPSSTWKSLPGGEYTWQVRAVDEYGELISTGDEAVFNIE